MAEFGIELRPVLCDWAPGGRVARLGPSVVGAWLVDLDAGLKPGAEVVTAEPGDALTTLSDDERARAARFVRARERRRFARCRAALRGILGRLLAEPPEALRFRAARVGKPELDLGPGRVHPLRFNVSHSGGLGIIAACYGREVGVDLEGTRTVSEAERIVASFFTSTEQAAFAAIPEVGRTEAFLRGWTRKEAVLKGIGAGISGLSSRIETGFGDGIPGPSFTRADPPHVDRWGLWEAAPRPGHVVALAVDLGNPPFAVDGPAGGSLPDLAAET